MRQTDDSSRAAGLILRGALVCDGTRAPHPATLLLRDGRIAAMLDPAQDAGAAGAAPEESIVWDLTGHMMDLGMSPLAALEAATSAGAALLGRSDLGVLAAGAVADLCAFRAGEGPVDLAAVLRAGKPAMVLQNGRLVGGTQPDPTPQL
jgi:cytosine/adenosine deaminase-related metal-dependent hydrolase